MVLFRNPPGNAGNVGSVPGLGTKIPHTAEQLNRLATTSEPVCHNEDPARCNEELTQPYMVFFF